MLIGQRNQHALDDVQLDRCRRAWELLTGNQGIGLDVSEAKRHGSKTRFNEARNVVLLGADAYPGIGTDANSRLSMLTCLAHELAHAQRFHLGFQRPIREPEMLVDEAETSLHASFTPELADVDRVDLVEDDRDRLIRYLKLRYEERR